MFIFSWQINSLQSETTKTLAYVIARCVFKVCLNVVGVYVFIYRRVCVCVYVREKEERERERMGVRVNIKIRK